MIDWTRLQHAYGNAADIPALLQALSPDPEAEVWSKLWSRVCHQGTVYSASFPVLPSLLDAANGWPPAGRVMPLSLAGGIACSQDRVGACDPAQFQSTIAALHGLALHTLSAAGLSRLDLVYLLQAALALDGDTLWGGCLDRIESGEFEGACPACAADLLLAVGQYGFFATTDEWVNRPETPRVPIQPAAPSDLRGVGRWLHQQAMAAGQPELALWVLHLFGLVACPACDSRIQVAEAIARAA
jgi:hypothetical protein